MQINFFRLPLAGNALDDVLKSCADVYSMSKSNLESVIALLENEALLLLNVLQEMHQVLHLIFQFSHITF